jgi:hypothetical protein
MKTLEDKRQEPKRTTIPFETALLILGRASVKLSVNIIVVDYRFSLVAVHRRRRRRRM